MTYLDANATAPLVSAARDAMLHALDAAWANPSSPHGAGGVARAVLESARDEIAHALGADPDAVIFTSGATEANNQVFASFAKQGGRRVLISPGEHPSISEPAEALGRAGLDLHRLPTNRHGRIDISAFESTLFASDVPTLVSVQWANGETGVVQPIQELALRVRQHPCAFLHSDAAQAFGRMTIDLSTTCLDAVSITSHKLHGPPGIGALVVPDPNRFEAMALLIGGGQEGGRRSGTTPVALAAGFGAAVAARWGDLEGSISRLRELRDLFEVEVLGLVPDAIINGAGAERIPNTTSIRTPGVDGMEAVARLDAAGVCCSQTSACSSARPAPSPALLALGLSEREAFETVRFSFSIHNTEAESVGAARAYASACAKMRRAAA